MDFCQSETDGDLCKYETYDVEGKYGGHVSYVLADHDTFPLTTFPLTEIYIYCHDDEEHL